MYKNESFNEEPVIAKYLQKNPIKLNEEPIIVGKVFTKKNL